MGLAAWFYECGMSFVQVRIAACLTVGLGLLSLLSGLFDFGLGALSIILGLVLAANGVLLFFGVTCKSRCTIKVYLAFQAACFLACTLLAILSGTGTVGDKENETVVTAVLALESVLCFFCWILTFNYLTGCCS